MRTCRPLVVPIALVLGMGATTAAAQGRAGRDTKRPAPAAAAPAAAVALPQVTAIALRVTGLGLGTNGTELKPFNESPGSTVALAIQAPKGSGIVAIDDHGSKLDAFSDDKGQSLLEESRVGPFPKIAEDGSAALVEVEVRARPAAGAASVSVQGSIAMTLAGGSKPLRASNVKLEADQTLKIGTTTLTVSDVKSQEESIRFTLNLPRSLLTTIRATRFFDTKGAPVEAERHGSGYFNEKAQLELEAKTKDKVIAIEFEVWQNLKTVKAPFNVQAGLASRPAVTRLARATRRPRRTRPEPAAAPAKPAGAARHHRGDGAPR